MRILLHYSPGPIWLRDLASLNPLGLEIDCCDESDDIRFYSLLPQAEILWHVLREVGRLDIFKANKLRLIQKIGVGVNTIDLDAAKARGIAVCNMPGTNTRAVAEMTLLLMLACLRRLPLLDRATRDGRGWKLNPALQDNYGELNGRTVGLVGYGAVAQTLAPVLEALAAKVIYTAKAPRSAGIGEFRPLADLLREADIVSLHLPLLCDFSFLKVDIKHLRESAGSRVLWLWPPNVRCGAGDIDFRMRLHLRPRTAGPIAAAGKQA